MCLRISNCRLALEQQTKLMRLTFDRIPSGAERLVYPDLALYLSHLAFDNRSQTLASSVAAASSISPSRCLLACLLTYPTIKLVGWLACSLSLFCSIKISGSLSLNRAQLACSPIATRNSNLLCAAQSSTCQPVGWTNWAAPAVRAADCGRR